MVPVAVLRDPALDHLRFSRDPGQADRRGPVDGIDPLVVPGAVARHLAGAQRPLPPDLPLGRALTADRRDRARLRRQPAARWLRRDLGPGGDGLLLHPLSDPAAADRQARDAAAI